MSRDDLIQMDGVVAKVHAGGNFVVKTDSGIDVMARMSGRMRRYRIRVVLGDRVTVAVSPYDPSRGFIVYRK